MGTLLLLIMAGGDAAALDGASIARGSTGAQLGGGRCYSDQPPPRAYCKPGKMCPGNTTCPACGAKFYFFYTVSLF